MIEPCEVQSSASICLMVRICGVTSLAVAGSVSSLLAGGDSLPTEQLPRPKMRKVTSRMGLRPAFVRRIAGTHRKLGVHDLIRPVQTATEVASLAA